MRRQRSWPEDSGNGWRDARQQPGEWLVRLRPRDALIYTTQSRTVLATGRDGFIDAQGQQGLWIYQTACFPDTAGASTASLRAW